MSSKPTLTVINVDEGDENADWIKRVNDGKSNLAELAIHDELAVEHGGAVKGGPGSGFHDHAGRVGEVGGSAPAGTEPAAGGGGGGVAGGQAGLRKIFNLVRSSGAKPKIHKGRVVGESPNGFAVFSIAGQSTAWLDTVDEAVAAYEHIQELLKARREERERRKAEQERARRRPGTRAG